LPRRGRSRGRRLRHAGAGRAIGPGHGSGSGIGGRLAVSVAIAVVGAYGVWVVYTPGPCGGRGITPRPRGGRARPAPRGGGRWPRRGMGDWLMQAGLEGVDRREFVAVVLTLGAVGGVGAYALFGGPLPAVAGALFAATFPVASYRARRERRRSEARDAWPRMI